MAKTADFKVVIDSTWVSEHLAEWLQEERAQAWDFCLDEIEQNDLNTAEAREGNPYRTEHQMSDNRELKEARELLVIRADHAGRLADQVRELEDERDGLLATIEVVREIASKRSHDPQRGFGGPPDDVPLEDDYVNFGEFYVAEEIRAALTTSPAQSLANLQSALVLEYIDSPEHAESLREVRCEVFRGLAGYFGQSDGSTWKDSLLAQMMREEAEKISKTTESETNHE